MQYVDILFEAHSMNAEVQCCFSRPSFCIDNILYVFLKDRKSLLFLDAVCLCFYVAFCNIRAASVSC